MPIYCEIANSQFCHKALSHSAVAHCSYLMSRKSLSVCYKSKKRRISICLFMVFVLYFNCDRASREDKIRFALFVLVWLPVD